MRSGSLFLLAGVTAVVAAVLLLRDGEHSRQPDLGGAGTLVFPELLDRVNDVTAITLSSGAETLTVKREGDGWRVTEKAGFPARDDVVKRTLLGLAELRIVEDKTARPELYAKLGVEDPAAPGAASTLVVLQAGGGAPLASLIVGHPGSSSGTLFVRRTGEAGALLARSSLALDRAATAWVDTALPRLPGARVKSVTTTHDDGERVSVARATQEDSVWAVQEVPEGMEPTSPTVGRQLAMAFEAVDFEDLRDAAAQPLPAGQQAVTVIESFDGLRLSVTSAVDEGRTWITLTAEATEGATEAVQAEVARIAALSPWAFLLPDYRATNLRKRPSDLLKPVAPAEPVPVEAEPGLAPADAAEPPAEAPPGGPSGPAAPAPSEPPVPAEAPAPTGAAHGGGAPADGQPH